MINVYAHIDAKGVPWFKRGRGFNRGLTVLKMRLKKIPPAKAGG